MLKFLNNVCCLPYTFLEHNSYRIPDLQFILFQISLSMAPSIRLSLSSQFLPLDPSPEELPAPMLNSGTTMTTSSSGPENSSSSNHHPLLNLHRQNNLDLSPSDMPPQHPPPSIPTPSSSSSSEVYGQLTRPSDSPFLPPSSQSAYFPSGSSLPATLLSSHKLAPITTGLSDSEWVSPPLCLWVAKDLCS